jgi:hypothetical protein
MPSGPTWVDGVGDEQEVLEELGGDVLVDRLVAGQLQGNGQHVEAEHGHPARGVGLLELGAAGDGLRAVEDADVVEAQEPALEHVAPGGVLAVDPPGEVEQQLVEHLLEEVVVGAPFAPAGPVVGVDLEHSPGGPGVHRGVDIGDDGQFQ